MSGAKAQVGRLLALVPLIRRRGEIHLDEAAQLLGVTPTQLVADLRVLIYCGWPGWLPGDLIEVDLAALEPGGDGMIRISNADYLGAPLRLSRAEASALIVALRALRNGADDAVLPTIDSALARIEAATGSVPVASVRPGNDQLAPLRATLESALRGGRRVRIRYLVTSRDEITTRTVDPLALVGHGGVAYLDAWCLQAGDRRSFRLDRILDARVLDEQAGRHDLPPLDLADGIFHPSPELPLVTLRLAERARWVNEYYPVESAREAGDGALEVTLRVADRAWLQRLLLRLTPHVTVLGPEEFTATYREAMSEARALYGPGVG